MKKRCPNPKCKGGNVRCEDCGGKGFTKNFFGKTNPCQKCSGIGNFLCSECQPCPDCKGKGTVMQFFPCLSCNSTGRIDKLTPNQRGDQALAQKQYDKAKTLYLEAANENDENAMYSLGIMYQNGLGVPRSTKNANEWFEKSQRRGHSGARQALKAYHKPNWKKQAYFCKGCNTLITNIKHKNCSNKLSPGIGWIDIENFEIRCDKCNNVSPLEDTIFSCRNGHKQPVEYTKDIVMVNSKDEVVYQDSDMIYKMDHSGRLIIGRYTYQGLGYLK